MSNKSITPAPAGTSEAVSFVAAVVLPRPAYLAEKINPETGEITLEPKYKYIIGAPKQYRFNGQNGQFNMNGEQILLDGKNKPISEFSLQPIAWRIFEENLFGRGRKETWAELFFVDERNRMASIMVNNTTLEGLRKLAEDLFYDDIELSDVVLTIKPEKAENEKGGQKRTWYIGRFSYQPADPETVKELKEYARDFPIYRRDTLTTTAVYLAKSGTYYVPLEEHPEEVAIIPEATPQAA